MNVNNSFDLNNSSTPLFDNRITYFMIIDNYMKRIVVARDTENFSLWFKLMKNLYLHLNQKLTDKERQEYIDLEKETRRIIVKYPYEYQNNINGRDKKNVYYLNEQLRKMDMWLYEKMEARNIFGRNRKIPGIV